MRPSSLALLVLLLAPIGAPAQDGLSDTMLRRSLASQGMAEIDELRREGSAVLGSGVLHGERVRFRADAHTGALREPSRLSENQIAHVLREAGYAEIEPVEQMGETWRMRASREGRPVELRVDGTTGRVLQQEVVTP